MHERELTRDELTAVHTMMRGWPIRNLIVDFDAARDGEVSGGHGLWDDDCRLDVTRKGIEGTVEDRPVIVTWARLRAWLATMPADIVAEARACRDEWSAICQTRDDAWKPWQLGPSWEQKYHTFGPLTGTAVIAIECDRREAALHARDRALSDRVFAGANQPVDLFDLLSVSGSA